MARLPKERVMGRYINEDGKEEGKDASIGVERRGRAEGEGILINEDRNNEGDKRKMEIEVWIGKMNMLWVPGRLLLNLD